MYEEFAYVYDKLINDIDYSALADYMEMIFSKYNAKPELVLDLGCGTGSFCIEMAGRGYEMIGVDRSLDMLACARNKALEYNADVLFLNQDITDFELYGTVDAIVCLTDCINYVTDKRLLNRCFKLVRNYLNPGGIFIFDINSQFKFEKVLCNNVFYEIDDEVTYIWKNKYNRKNRICEFDLTFFVKEGELYRKFEELHYERCYSIEELKTMIDKSGLVLLDIFDAYKLSPPEKNSERIFFVCRRDK